MDDEVTTHQNEFERSIQSGEYETSNLIIPVDFPLPKANVEYAEITNFNSEGRNQEPEEDDKDEDGKHVERNA